MSNKHYIQLGKSYRYLANDGQIMILEPTGRYIIPRENGIPSSTFEYEFDIIKPYDKDNREGPFTIWLPTSEVDEILEMSFDE